MNENKEMIEKKKVRKFPSPTGVNYYESELGILTLKNLRKMFPSPTGVNYYESYRNRDWSDGYIVFPSPTGVNYYELFIEFNDEEYQDFRFRPQQGLTIMNPSLQNPDKH